MRGVLAAVRSLAGGVFSRLQQVCVRRVLAAVRRRQRAAVARAQRAHRRQRHRLSALSQAGAQSALAQAPPEELPLARAALQV